MKNFKFMIVFVSIIFLILSPAILSQGKPDLKPRITCPKYAKPGEDLGDKIKVITENIGQIIAKEIGVDLVLSSDTVIPTVTAVYKPGWGEDVLLLGGREFIKELPAGASVNVKMNGNNRIPADTPSGIYYIGVFVDSTFKNDELSESNNSDVCRIYIRSPISGGDNAAGTPGTPTTISQGKPDLKPRITCPKYAKAGEDLGDKIKVITTNIGQAIAKEIGVDLVLSSDTVIPTVTAVYKPGWGEDVLLLGGREFISELPAGASVNVKMNGNNRIPADTPSGIYYIGVFVDSTFKNDELSESNNSDVCRILIRGHISGGDNAAGTPGTHTTPALLPDLKMEKVYVTPDPVDKGTKTDLHCEFKNVGGDLVGTWRVSYQIDGKEVYTQKWGDIPAGGFRNPSGVWVAGEPGKHIFRCVLDPDNAINESNESNNALKMEFNIKGETGIHRIKPGHTVPISTGVISIARPDLVVRISASNKAYSGDPIQVIELVVKNVGTAKAKGTDTAGKDGYVVDIVLSKDNDLPVEFAVLGDKYKEDMLLIGGRMSHTPDLAPGESKTWLLKRIIRTLPDTPTGKYCLGAVVDPGLKINESNEANNTHCTAINLLKIVK